jgi:prophage tail gpP-like protein
MASGVLYGRKNHLTADKMTKTLNFYSRTADLIDSNLFPSTAEIVKSDLKKIADVILGAGNFGYEFIDDPGKAFANVQRNDVEMVSGYFQRLAAQRGLFVSCNEFGKVVFQKLHTDGESVANIEYGVTKNATEYSVEFNDRLRFGKIVAVTDVESKSKGTPSQAGDPDVPTTRFFLFHAHESDGTDLASDAAWMMIRTSLDAYSFSVPVSGFYDDNGEPWRPNTKVTLKAPILDAPDAKTFIIRAVEFGWSGDNLGASLLLVPPLSVGEDGLLKIWDD